MRQIAPGACLLEGWLDASRQRELAAQCLRLLDSEVGGYVPTVRGGGKMRVRMLCLGRHWNPRTYTYEAHRGDFDGQAVPPIPAPLLEEAARTAAAVGFELEPDICLINQYGDDGRMGLHQDKDERPETIAAGSPIVSFSLGDTARFLFGGLRRRDPVEPLLLASGDALVFGGAARLRYHGVARILPGTGPSELAPIGRINLTFRRY